MKHALRNRPLQVNRLGVEENPFEDMYYQLLRMSWLRFLGTMLTLYIGLNALFATAYWSLNDAIANIGPLNYFSYFAFSVQTMSTVGYGFLYPKTDAANFLVIVQTTFSLFYTAGLTGMIFAKFSAPRSRIIFTENILITKQNGQDVLCLRLGNYRANRVFEGRAVLNLLRDEISLEGERLRRLVELKLQRNVTPVFALSWTLFHPLDADSPLTGMTPEKMRELNWEIYVTFTGLDEDIKAPIVAHNTYGGEHVIRARKFADMITVENRRRTIDYSKLNEIEYD